MSTATRRSENGVYKIRLRDPGGRPRELGAQPREQQQQQQRHDTAVQEPTSPPSDVKRRRVDPAELFADLDTDELFADLDSDVDPVGSAETWDMNFATSK